MFMFLALVAAQLDAPVTQQPTVRSELKNGFEAGEPCAAYDAPPESIAPCFQRLRTAYRLSHPSFEAFLLGLDLREWMVGDLFVKVGGADPKNPISQAAARLGRIAALQGQGDAITQAAAVHVSLDQAFAAVGVPPSEIPQSEIGN